MKLALPLCLALLCQIPAAKPAASSETLRFNWPQGLTARVATERVRERQGKTLTSVKASVRMRAEPHADGLLIRYDEFKSEGTLPNEVGAASETLAAMVPNLIVSREGAFLRVEDIGALKAAATSLFEPLYKDSVEMPAGLKNFLTQFLSEQGLTSIAVREWEMLVGMWSELPLSAEKFEVATEQPTPLWPDVKVPMKVTGGMVEKGTCARGGAKIDCAVFEMRSSFDQAAMQPILARLLEGMKDLKEIKYERIDVVTVTRIRLETHTMVPHELAMTRTTDMTLSKPGEGRLEMKQADRRTSRFSY